MQDDSAINLVVRSAEDVTMLSAFLQDGLIAHHDIHFDQDSAQVMMVVDRYRWEVDASRTERVLMGLRIGKVEGLSQKKMRPQDQAQTGLVFYNLLQLAYEEDNSSGKTGKGTLLFTFSAGAALRLDVGGLMMSAGDIAPPRPAVATPQH